ncbi:MAG: replication-associated recombination protein A, partial [Acidobacteria bacterium]|nr:replication-associated recombination protein A [Acidobacteriota bacterium]
DEIHRFNKSQQDAFLPYVERGDIFLIGATTENPSFEIIGPLLSRTTVYVLKALDSAQVASLLQRALVDGDRGLADSHMEIPSELLGHIATISNGDVRAAYNILESLALGIAPNSHGHRPVKKEILEDVLQRRMLPYDKSGEEHFNLISALHKSVRNSDADATLYWLARMLESGEDPLYIARRLVRMASEDIGLAEPGALGICIAAMNAADLLGVPECNLALAQAAVYLSLAPKSNALYTGYGRVAEDLKHSSADPVPLHLRNAVTGLMANQGYGRGYQYAHNAEEKVTGMTCLPDSLADRKYYQPTDQGFEARLRQRMEEIRNIRSKKAGENPSSSKAAKK